MGFESNKRVIKVMNNRRVTETIGGKLCHFRSQFEYDWASYLQWQKENNLILNWEFESRTFNFQNHGYNRGPFMYLIDFTVTENDGHVLYQECKGYHDGQTNSKFQRTLACYPDLSKNDFELILMRIPKRGKGANRRRVAEKYVRRIVDASEIFKQIKGVI